MTCSCDLSRRRLGVPQCPSFFVWNGHRHHCCSTEPHPAPHFCHCADLACVAMDQNKLRETFGVRVALVSVSWSETAEDEQSPIAVPWTPPADRPVA